MARPPQIPNWLADHLPTIYFATFCSANRAKVLACPEVFEKFHLAREKAEGWCVLSAVVRLKRWMRQGDPAWQWQAGCFDRLLRSDESAQQKWEYMRENTVRAGLVKRWEEWPYRWDSSDKL